MLIALLGAWARAQAPAAPPAATGARSFVLDSGLTVIVDPVAGSGVVHVGVRHAPPASADPRTAALVHLAGHALLLGSISHPEPPWATIEAAGGSVSWSGLYLGQTVRASHLERMLALESDRLGWRDDLDADGLEAQLADLRLEAAAARPTSPWGRVPPPGDGWHHLAHDEASAGPIGLDAQALAGLRADEVDRFLDAILDPGRAILVVSGDLEPAAVEGLVRRWFSEVPASAGPGSPPSRWAGGVTEVQTELASSAVLLEWPLGGDAEPRLDPVQARFLAALLGGSEVARLTGRLLHDERVAGDADVTVVTGATGGPALRVKVVGEPGIPAADLVAAVDAGLASFGDRPPSAEELAAAHRLAAVAVRSAASSPAGRARLLAELLASGLPPDLDAAVSGLEGLSHEGSSAQAAALALGGAPRSELHLLGDPQAARRTTRRHQHGFFHRLLFGDQPAGTAP